MLVRHKNIIADRPLKVQVAFTGSTMWPQNWFTSYNLTIKMFSEISQSQEAKIQSLAYPAGFDVPLSLNKQFTYNLQHKCNTASQKNIR